MKRATPSLLALAATTFAADIDRDIPIAPGTSELRVGYNQGFGTGGYDIDGKKWDASGSPITTNPMLQAKYGVAPGVEIEAALLYELRNADASWTGESIDGLRRPELGVKYLHQELGLGAFAVLYAPIGSEDIEGEEPITTIEGGVLYGERFDRTIVNASLSYVFNTESEGLWKQDRILLSAKGTYELDGRLAPSFALEFDKALEAKYDGKSQTDSDGHVLVLRPGATWAANDRMRLEGSLPFTVTGRNSYAWWGISLAGIWSFGG